MTYLQNPPPLTNRVVTFVAFWYVLGCNIYYIQTNIYKLILWLGQTPNPPFQFIILKSILYQNCDWGFCSFTHNAIQVLIVIITQSCVWDPSWGLQHHLFILWAEREYLVISFLFVSQTCFVFFPLLIMLHIRWHYQYVFFLIWSIFFLRVLAFKNVFMCLVFLVVGNHSGMLLTKLWFSPKRK